MVIVMSIIIVTTNPLVGKLSPEQLKRRQKQKLKILQVRFQFVGDWVDGLDLADLVAMDGHGFATSYSGIPPPTANHESKGSKEKKLEIG